ACFFTADVSTGASVDVNLNIETGAENVLSDEIIRSRFLDGAFQDSCALGKFAPDVDVSGPGVEGETGDENALDQLMRIVVNDIPILERARLGFVRVAAEIDRFFLIRFDETPLHPAGEPGAAAPAQAGGLHFVHDLAARHFDGGF